jgi:large subunit ribosomal protein L10
MGTIRDGKVAVVDAVRARLDDADGAVVTEYRGLTVAEMAGLRRALRAVGGDYKVFKNTLVRRAVEGSAHEPLTGLLEGPTAIAFVQGDVSAVAKALRDFARSAPALVVKGGVLDGSLLDARELAVLADLPSRELLLSMFAGALAAPLRNLAGLLKAMPQGLAYGLSALIESRGGAPVPAEDVAEPVAESSDNEASDEEDAPVEAAAADPVPAVAEGAPDEVAGPTAAEAATPAEAEPPTETDADPAPSEDEPAGD